MLTQAAVPYCDPTLTDAAGTIRQQRQQEQATSPLGPTSQWRRRWLFLVLLLARLDGLD